ncbi:MAG: HAD family hydrolase [Oscillospiraceae bacterium]|nr:HAD family hydrolase [Oscillospiraceae bacterium]
MYNTILFDLDGTLAPFLQDEFIRAYFQLLVRRLTPMGYDGDKLVQALWVGVDAMIRNDGSGTNRQVFWDVFTRELGIQALALESVLNDFYAREFDAARSVLREDADRSGLIRSLRKKGYALALATNPLFPAVAVETRLGWVGLAASDFDHITTYENSRRSKPNPDYYRDILTHMGKQGGECLMIGNNPLDDMAAREAGLAVYLVTDCLENPDGLPVNAYPHGSFRELEAILMELPAL